jgi:hypothetical protein
VPARRCSQRSPFLATLCFLALTHPAPAADSKPTPATVRLTAGGRALLPVVVPTDASPRVRAAARTLADYLGRISGATFTIAPGDGSSGIVLGRNSDFPYLKSAIPWSAGDGGRREDYLLQSHAKGLRLIGATDLAVEHAVWDMLHRLGHRQFFPGKTWEVVPRSADLAIAVSTHEHPDYLSREIGFGFGPWGVRRELYEEWGRRNRLGFGTGDRPYLESGHSFESILAAHRDEFARHPEYHALVGGKRRHVPDEAKFCISNAGLRKLVASHAVTHFIRHPGAHSVSLDPSDGLSWCECEDCRKMGSISDRVVTLVNEAAAAVLARHGRDRRISIYAYAAHAPPPHLAVDPQVVVSVATSMTLGDFTTEELIDGWRKKGAQIGIREYYGVYPWDCDLPGGPRLANLALLAETTPRFHRLGARFLCAESSDDWGVAGLGYYLVARMLWDVREAGRAEAIRDDFLHKAFGTARKPMAEFYRLIDAGSRPRLSSDLIGRLYRALDEARKKTDDPAIAVRLDDLTLYVRYVELYHNYVSAEGAERQRGFEALVRYAYRIRDRGMAHSLAVWRGLPYYDRSVRLPPGTDYAVPEGKDPWKQSKPFTRAEVRDLVSAGIARHRLVDFTPTTWSKNLVPVDALRLPKMAIGSAELYFRNRAVFYTWGDKAPPDLPLTVKPGLIYQNVGPARLSLHQRGASEAVGRAVLPPDRKEHLVRLQANGPGLHRVELADRSAGTALSGPAGMRWAIPAGPEEAVELYGRWTLYFYVPRGTKEVIGYSAGVGELHDGDGKKVFAFSARPDYFRVSVSAPQQGRLWRFTSCLGRKVLLNVPPYLARDNRELLLPEEVVRADAPK